MIARIRVNGREILSSEYPANASLIETEADVYSVLWEGRSYEVRVSGNSYQVKGQLLEVEVEDPRDVRRNSSNRAVTGQQILTTPMPGRVVRVLVSVGARVEAGQGIVVMEAMKMQNEMKAVRAGVVTSLLVAEGSAVASGDLLAVID